MTRWIVDGMNVIGSRPDGWWRDRRRAMRKLVEALRAVDEPVTVVFDGAPVELDEGGGVEVLFAARRGRDAADDDIAELVAAAEDPASLCVVTSDGDLARRVAARGAQVVTAGAFRRRWLDHASSEE